VLVLSPPQALEADKKQAVIAAKAKQEGVSRLKQMLDTCQQQLKETEKSILEVSCTG
jgi:hypothetical protein